MLWVVLIINIITLFGVLGLVNKVGELEDSLRRKNTLLDDGKEPDWLETPVKKPARKQAVRKTTTLRKQKRAANGRFA